MEEAFLVLHVKIPSPSYCHVQEHRWTNSSDVSTAIRFFCTAFDQLPEYEPFPTKADSFQTVAVDDYRNFLESHRGHRMEDLRIIEDSFVSEKAFIEPVKVSYFKATNGKERFVIRKSREHILEPLTYDLIYGDFALNCRKSRRRQKRSESRWKTNWRIWD